MTTLVQSMQQAWINRGEDALRILVAARKAPALFKPETIEQAQRDYQRAEAEFGRWSA
jgi:hypothetical protein